MSSLSLVFTPSGPGGGSGLFSGYALLRHEENNGVDAGGFTSGSFQTVTVNTEKFDPQSIVSLSSNQFTPISGTYFLRAWMQSYHGRNFKCRIRNVTAGTTTIVGSNGRAYDSNENHGYSIATGRFTANGTDAYELQARCDLTVASFGFGVAANHGEIEVYAEVELWKE